MSFRELAQDVGVKSASVHYHFPTKEILGEALIEHYSDRFKQALEAIDRSDLQQAFHDLTELYAQGLVLDQALCLCAVLGAEALGLSEGMKTRIKLFFDMNVQWLAQLFEEHGFEQQEALATMLIAALEGAMIVASASSDRARFDSVTLTLRQIVQSTLK